MRPPKILRHDDTLPPIGQAFHVAILAMKAAKVPNWAQFDLEAEQGTSFALTEQQQQWLETLREHGLATKLSITPLITVAVCQECGKYVYASSKAVSKACRLTLSCPGPVRKVSSMPKRVGS